MWEQNKLISDANTSSEIWNWLNVGDDFAISLTKLISEIAYEGNKHAEIQEYLLYIAKVKGQGASSKASSDHHILYT